MSRTNARHDTKNILSSLGALFSIVLRYYFCFSAVPDSAAVKNTAATDATSLPTVWTSVSEIRNGENCWVGTINSNTGEVDVQPATIFDYNECFNQFGDLGTANDYPTGLFCAAQPSSAWGDGNALPPICMPNHNFDDHSTIDSSFGGFGAPIICEVNGVATLMGIYEPPRFTTGDCGPGTRSEFYYFTEQEASNIQNVMDYNNNYESQDTSAFELLGMSK